MSIDEMADIVASRVVPPAKFEDKVKEALQAVMKHAVTGHQDSGYNTFCSDAEHALDILHDFDLQPVNRYTLEKVLPNE